MNRLAIFDCDGTLVDSGANICLAMEDCFTRASLPPPARERTRAVVGLSLVEAMQAMLPDAERHLHVALAEDFKGAFQQLRGRGLVEEPLYDGVSELIDALEAGGWLLGVATGKSDRGLSLCLDHHRLASRFVTLQTADRHPSKPHPSMIEQAMLDVGASPASTVMIGDTSYDMAMARAAGVTAIGVAWGYHDRQELLAAGAHYIADRPAQIAELVNRLPMIPEPPRADDATWRNRFILINVVRIGGTLVVLFGLFVWQSDWLRSGGAVEIGLPLAIMGLIVSFWGPIALARRWRTPPGR